MNSLKQLIAAAGLAVLACTALQAQKVVLKATIPFKFSAGQKLLPPGEYVIQEETGYIVLNHEEQGKRTDAVILLTFGATTAARSFEGGALSFNNYGGEYFLTKIRNPHSTEGRQLPATAREEVLAKRGGVPVQTTVALASKQ